MTFPAKFELMVELGLLTSSEVQTILMAVGSYYISLRLAPDAVKRQLGLQAAAAWETLHANHPADAEKIFNEAQAQVTQLELDAQVERFLFKLHQQLPELDPQKFPEIFRQCLEDKPCPPP